MVGRPKRQFSQEEIQLIEQYARNNCLTNTIAVALEIPLMTLKRHFGKKLRIWRAQGKVELREFQRNLAETSCEMAKFLGKNELNQVDKQEIKQTFTQPEPLTGVALEAQKRANLAYKMARAKGA